MRHVQRERADGSTDSAAERESAIPLGKGRAAVAGDLVADTALQGSLGDIGLDRQSGFVHLAQR